MWKLSLGKGVREFLSTDSSAVRLVGVILLGPALIIMGSISSRSVGNKQTQEQTGEERVAEMCSLIEGVGECRVMMTYTSDGDEVFAVLVLCEGADSIFVREKITSLFTSLYGIGSHRVEIQRLNN